LSFQDVINAVSLFLEFQDNVKACPDEVSVLRQKLKNSEDDVARLAGLVELMWILRINNKFIPLAIERILIG
jgi:hypothetical protein